MGNERKKKLFASMRLKPWTVRLQSQCLVTEQQLIPNTFDVFPQYKSYKDVAKSRKTRGKISYTAIYMSYVG